METLIICVSVHHRNTEKIAQAMANTLKAKLLHPFKIPPGRVLNYDLIGFGSGIYFGNYHPLLTDFVQKIPQTKNKRAFLFSTSGQPPSAFFNRRSKNLRKVLLSKGFKIIKEFNCPGFDTYGLLKFVGGINKGRPNEKDLKKAGDFAFQLFKHEKEN